MTRVLAVANAKGGVGKTTTTINTAAALIERGRKVLVLDLDPQASLSLSLGACIDGNRKTIYDALTAAAVPLNSIVQRTAEEFDLAPASHELNRAVDFLDGDRNRVLAVRAVLEPIRDRYDYVLMDCPANAGILTGSALAAADEVVIPFAVDHLAFQALGWFLGIIDRVKASVNPELKIAGIVFTMFDPRTRHARKIMEAARLKYGAEIPFFASAIRYSVSLRDASLMGKSVLRYAPESVAGDSYRSLAREIEEGLTEASTNELYLALARADKALARKDLATAYAEFCRVTDLSPQLARGWIGRAESAGEWEEKVRCYGHAVHLEPGKAEPRANLAKCVMDGVSPTSLEGIHPLIASAHYLESIGQQSLADRLFQRVNEIDPKHCEAWMGRARLAPGPREAIAIVQQFLALDPTNSTALAQLRAEQDRSRSAAAQLVEKGVSEVRLGNRETAHALFTEAIELDPKSDSAWLERARTAVDFRLAFEYVKRALEINPKNEQARELHNLLYEPDEAQPGEPTLWFRWVLPILAIVILIVAILFISGRIAF